MTDVTVIGFPFGSSGRSEHVRAVWRALDAAGVRPSLYDCGGPGDDEGIEAEFRPHVVDQLPRGIRIYSLNGDEVAVSVDALEDRQPGVFRWGYNIVFPAWELPRYPDVWARELDRFDEVWTASPFADRSIRAAVTIRTVHLPNACEPHLRALIGRSHFGIPENRFVVLFFFDLWSYTSRKNPWAVIEAFRRLAAARPSAPIQLVIKLNHSAHDPRVSERIAGEIADLGPRVTVVDATMTDNEVKNLVRCCDCFLSLHRSEGFGRGPAEAMFLGKPVVATGWSGNMEYMEPGVSFPVAYRLVPVDAGEYPHGENQIWADPDVGHAAQILVRLVDDPSYARAVGERACTHMRTHYSDVALGRRYRARLEAIVAGTGVCPRPDEATPSPP